MADNESAAYPHEKLSLRPEPRSTRSHCSGEIAQQRTVASIADFNKPLDFS